MPVKITFHVQAAHQWLHMMFEHGADAMGTGMKQPFQQFTAFDFEPRHRLQSFICKVLLGEGKKGVEVCIVAALHSDVMILPDYALHLRIDHHVLAACANT
jgi:hypothetical protein